MILARLVSAAPQPDGEHWDLVLRRHYDVMHTDAYAQNPAPYQRNPQTSAPQRPPYPWRPNAQGLSSDSLWPGRSLFSVAVNTNNSPATLDIYGQPPVNTPAAMNAPQCPLQATVATTGGFVPAGTYLIKIGAGPAGPVSPRFIKAVVPGGTTNGTITISGIVWYGAAPGPTIYVGSSALTMHGILSSSWGASASDSNGNPTTLTIILIDPDGVGLPDPIFNSFLFNVKDIVHGGVWGATVSAVGVSGGQATATISGASFSSNQWLGRTLSIYSPTAGTAVNWTVASNDATTLKLDAVGGHGPPAGAVVVMRSDQASISPNTIGSSTFVNCFSTGLSPNAEIGNLIMIIGGTGANQPPVPIASNTGTVCTIQGTWVVTPDATSIWIIVAPAWRYSVSSSTFVSTGPFVVSAPRVGSIPLLNYSFGQLLVEAVTVDRDGNWSVERYAPIREVWVPPIVVPGNYTSDGYFLNTIAGGSVTIDLAKGLSQEIVLPTPAAAFTIANVIFTGGTIANSSIFRLRIVTPASGNFMGPTFGTGAGAFAASTQSQYSPSPANNVADVMEFQYRGSVFGMTRPPIHGVSLT